MECPPGTKSRTYKKTGKTICAKLPTRRKRSAPSPPRKPHDLKKSPSSSKKSSQRSDRSTDASVYHPGPTKKRKGAARKSHAVHGAPRVKAHERLPKYTKTASALAKYGVVVVPVFADDAARQKWEDRMWKALDSMPEYKVKGKTAQRVLGGFGALGNPSSFHHPDIQTLRMKLKKNVSMPLFRALKHRLGLNSKTRLEMLFDRVCIRFKDFGAVSAESWHRDIYDGPKFGYRALPKTLDDGKDLDEIFGGWLNLSNRPTHFKAIVQSHVGDDAKDAQRKGGGFATLTEAQIRKQRVEERLKRQANLKIGTATTNGDGLIVVPPGHQVIFFQRLLHAVASGPGPVQPQLRLFVGHRLTQESTPLFPLERVINNNAVPPIPSGQMPPMFSQNHYQFFASHDKYQSWAGSTFQPGCLFARKTTSGKTYYTPGSKDDIDKDANKKRYMPSLSSMGFSTYAYSDRSIAALTPEVL